MSKNFHRDYADSVGHFCQSIPASLGIGAQEIDTYFRACTLCLWAVGGEAGGGRVVLANLPAGDGRDGDAHFPGQFRLVHPAGFPEFSNFQYSTSFLVASSNLGLRTLCVNGKITQSETGTGAPFQVISPCVIFAAKRIQKRSDFEWMIKNWRLSTFAYPISPGSVANRPFEQIGE